MKSRSNLRNQLVINRLSNLTALGALALALFAGPVWAQSTYYWDNNSTTAGFGTAGGTWLAPTLSQWSTDATGLLAPGASITTTTSDALHFGTATDGLTAGTITLSGTVSANSLTFGSASGAVLLSGGIITLGGTTPTVTVNNATNTISRLSGTGGLIKAGSGTLILQAPAIAANARPGPSGSVVVNAGTLRYETVTADPDYTASYAINNGSTLQINGGNLRTLHNGSSFTFGATGGGTITIDNANPILNNSTFTTTGGTKNTVSGTANFNGQTSPVNFDVAVGSDPIGLELASNLGNLKLVKKGAGVMAVSSTTNSISSGIQIDAGTLEIISAGRLGSGSYAGNILNNASFVYNSTATQTLSGIISGTGSFTKNNTSTLTLSGANSYSGNTIISAGALEVNNTTGSGTGSGTVTVDSILKGDGSITAAANNFVYINGTLQVGQTSATAGQDFSLTTSGSGSTTFGGSSILGLDLWSTTGTDQSGTLAAADMLRLFGDVSIAGTSLLKLGNPNALTFQPGDMFKVFDWAGLGTLTGTFATDFSDITLTPGTYIDSSNLYTTGIISIASIPEPSRALLLMAGVCGMTLRRRRVA